MISDTLAPSGEVTFLFTDIEASTAAWDRDTPTMNAAQQRHDEILRSAIAAEHGYVFSTAGDGLAAAFPRADGALRAAVTAQRAITLERWPESAPVRVRMGLHTGRAIERGGDYFGPAVIRAARLMALVDGGRIVCSQRTGEAANAVLAEGVELTPVGTAKLKGLSTPEVVLAVRAAGLAETGSPVSNETTFGRQLPRPLERLVGRDAEVQLLAQRVRPGALVTLTGIGGVGKTRLATTVAQEVATAFDDGAVWVDLATVGRHADVAQLFADVLGVRTQPNDDLQVAVCQALGAHRLLLVLDNCEHVQAAVAPLVRSLRAECAMIGLLATSRERLGSVGEQPFEVTPLRTEGDDPPAVDLLTERIGLSPNEVTPEAQAALDGIARRLDGLPLALELAAARCRALGIAEVAARLHSIRLLADDHRMEARHQTLEAAIAWSYDLLTEHERTIFDRLSVFAGPFRLQGAEQVAAGAVPDVDAVVASLVDKSLINHTGHWFRLLETTRQFAGERLARSPALPSVRRAHVAYVLDQVRQVRAGLHGRDEAEWVDALDVMWPDVRAAVLRSFEDDDAERAVALVVQLAFEGFWRRPEVFGWIDDALSRFGDRAGELRHELLGAAGFSAWVQLDLERGARLGEAALDSYSPGSGLDCLPEGAVIGTFAFTGRYEEALEIVRRVIPVLERGPDRWNEAFMRANLALLGAIGGTARPEASQQVNAAIALGRALGNPTILAYALYAQALLLASEDPVVAAPVLESAVALASSVGNQWIAAQATVSLVTAVGAGGHDADTVAKCLEGADELQRTGWVVHAWGTLWGVIEGLDGLGRRDVAALLLGGCEASGVARYAYQSVPSELDQQSAQGADPRLAALRAMGRFLGLRELISIAAGTQPLPPVAH